MNASEFSEFLIKHKACADARRWAEGKSLSEAWEQCERGDWLLWLCLRMVGQPGWPTHMEVVLTYLYASAITADDVGDYMAARIKALRESAPIFRYRIHIPSICPLRAGPIVSTGHGSY